MKYGNLTLDQIEAGINKIGGEEAFMRFLRDELVVSEATAKKLLERLPVTIALPAVKDFVAKNNFVIGTSNEAKFKISDLGTNFRKHFLPREEWGEVAAEELAVNKLLENAYDAAIITALGGKANAEITLGQFFAAFAKQPNGEEGQLPTNGHAIVGYVRDKDRVLWAVGGFWGVGGWYFEAHSLGDPDRWSGGFQFLSR